MRNFSLFFFLTALFCGPSFGQTDAIVFVPGYRGTFLLDRQSKTPVFINLRQALFGNKTLTRRDPMLGFLNPNHLVPGRVIDAIPVIPYLYDYQGYGPLINKMRSYTQNATPVIPFPYDWRESPEDVASELEKTIQKLAKTHSSIALFCHSYGGIICAQYLRYPMAGEWSSLTTVNRVVTLGTPFSGTVQMMIDFIEGKDIWLNQTLLSPEANGSFTSTYRLMPHAGFEHVLNKEGQDVTARLFDPKLWAKERWGAFAPSLEPSLIEKRLVFVDQQMQAAKSFFQKLRAPLASPLTTSTRLLYIYSDHIPTLSRGILEGDQLYYDQDKLPEHLKALKGKLYEPGDGLIARSTAIPPKAFSEALKATALKSDQGHGSLGKGTEFSTMMNFLLQKDDS